MHTIRTTWAGFIGSFRRHQEDQVPADGFNTSDLASDSKHELPPAFDAKHDDDGEDEEDGAGGPGETRERAVSLELEEGPHTESSSDHVYVWRVLSDSGLCVHASPHRAAPVLAHLPEGSEFMALNRGGLRGAWVQHAWGWSRVVDDVRARLARSEVTRLHKSLAESEPLAPVHVGKPINAELNDKKHQPFVPVSASHPIRTQRRRVSVLPRRSTALPGAAVALSRSDTTAIGAQLVRSMHGDSAPRLARALSLARAWDYPDVTRLRRAEAQLAALRALASARLASASKAVEAAPHKPPQCSAEKRRVRLTQAICAAQVIFHFDSDHDGRMNFSDFLIFARHARLRVRRQPLDRQRREFVRLCEALGHGPLETDADVQAFPGISAAGLCRIAPISVLRDAFLLSLHRARAARPVWIAEGERASGIVLNVRARGLRDADPFAGSRPFLIVSRQLHGDDAGALTPSKELYRSEWVRDDLNPTWDRFRIPVTAVDETSPLLFLVRDQKTRNGRSADVKLGQASATITQLRQMRRVLRAAGVMDDASDGKRGRDSATQATVAATTGRPRLALCDENRAGAGRLGHLIFDLIEINL